MVLTILGGGYLYFYSSPSEVGFAVPVSGPDDLNRFVADMATALRSAELSENDTFVLARAAMEWTKDPFLASGLQVTTEAPIDREKALVKDINFAYSGYIDMGDLKLAIINGLEYELGEALEGGRYIIKGISPVRVVIGVSGGTQEIILPLVEMD